MTPSHTQEWWKDKVFTAEFDHRYHSLENGTHKGYTLDEVETVNSAKKVWVTYSPG